MLHDITDLPYLVPRCVPVGLDEANRTSRIRSLAILSSLCLQGLPLDLALLSSSARYDPAPSHQAEGVSASKGHSGLAVCICCARCHSISILDTRARPEFRCTSSAEGILCIQRFGRQYIHGKLQSYHGDTMSEDNRMFQELPFSVGPAPAHRCRILVRLETD